MHLCGAWVGGGRAEQGRVTNQCANLGVGVAVRSASSSAGLLDYLSSAHFLCGVQQQRQQQIAVHLPHWGQDTCCCCSGIKRCRCLARRPTCPHPCPALPTSLPRPPPQARATASSASAATAPSWAAWGGAPPLSAVPLAPQVSPSAACHLLGVGLLLRRRATCWGLVC